MKISNYDEQSYDYSTYWNNREYENEAEKIVLERFLKNEKGNWFIDIGGSFGRNTPLYSNKYKQCIIGDYSLETLIKNRDEIVKRFPNTELIALNAYNLPFRENSFDGAMMIRVLHHISNPEEYFSELTRVLSPNSIYIQEIANKIHIKAALKHISKGDFSFFNHDQYQQPSQGNNEGGDGSKDVFLNFHPAMISKQLKEKSLKQIDRFGASYLRIPQLKKFIKPSILVNIERILQFIFKYTYIAPSIFIKFKSMKENKIIVEKSNLQDILCCPKCKGELEINVNDAKCITCSMKYEKKDNIWDFRI